MTASPAKIYQPFKYSGIFLEAHEFYLARVDWDWKHPYHDEDDWTAWDAMWEAIEQGKRSDVDRYEYKSLDPEAKSCNRWLLDHLPEVFHWLNFENRIRYYVRSSGDGESQKDATGKLIMASSWTVACLCIWDTTDAMAFRMRWC